MRHVKLWQPCWTNNASCAIGARCTGFCPKTTAPTKDAISFRIHAIESQSCGQRAATCSGPRKSPNLRDRTSGPTMCSILSWKFSADTSFYGPSARASPPVWRMPLSRPPAHQGIRTSQLVVHTDRGGPKTLTPVSQRLNDLRVERSLTRPYTFDDNPYSKAQFNTVKYRSRYP